MESAAKRRNLKPTENMPARAHVKHQSDFGWS